jgi:hypothetical protein
MPISVTDQPGTADPNWLPRLKSVIRGSTHESRNALNGLVVNLEVVRSRLARAADGTPDVLPFAEQAMGQAEGLVKLNEAIGSLLTLIAGAIGPDGRLNCVQSAGEPSRLRFEVDQSTAERTVRGLQTLGGALGFSAETDGGAVILTFPRDSSTESTDRE